MNYFTVIWIRPSRKKATYLLVTIIILQIFTFPYLDCITGSNPNVLRSF